MKPNTIICISREFGSGGHEIAEKLSRKLGIKLFDKEIISKVAEMGNLSEEYVERKGESRDFSFIFEVPPNAYLATDVNYDHVITSEKLFTLQSIAIKRMAEEEGSCIFVGRCADVILQEFENCYSFFICGSLEERIHRIKKIRGLTEKESKKLVKKTDRERASYHNFYTGVKWRHPSNYDLMINTTKMGIDKAVQVITDYVE